MAITDYAQYDGLGLAELVRKRDVRPVELVEEAINRIEKHNDTLNAVVYRAYDEAIKISQTALPPGPFKGVPFLIKDLGLQVKGWPRTDGTYFIGDAPDKNDSRLVTRHREAGMVLVGKTNTPEFGIAGTTEGARLGPCRTPWNPEHISGGSSGGAASAVASGMVPMAHASDGLGSIRNPAACCGLFGLKVTRDRNPAGPTDYDRCIGFSVDHIVSRSVRDSAAMLDWTGHPDPDAPFSPPPRPESYLKNMETPPKRLLIAAWSTMPTGVKVHQEVRTGLERVMKMLEDLGHVVEEQDLPIDYGDLYRAQFAVSGANFSATMERRIKTMGREPKPHELEALTRSNWESGKKITGAQALRGLQNLRVLSRKIISFFQTYDIFLTPVMGTVPPKIGYLDPVNLEPREMRKRQAEAFPFTPPFNMTGQPAMNVPLVWSSDDLPMGMQFAGRYGDEETLLKLAGQLEAAYPWANRHPKIWD